MGFLILGVLRTGRPGRESAGAPIKSGQR